MALTFDTVDKRIILDVATITVKEIYKQWVDWLVLSDNAKYLPAFSSVGGDDLGGGISIPPYYFLTNGWRVRPMESNHTLVLTGNLFVAGGGDPIVSTLGNYNVLIRSVVPVQAQVVATGGGGGGSVSAADVAAEVRSLLSVELTRILELPTSVPSSSNIATAVNAAIADRLDVPISSRQPSGIVVANVKYVNDVQLKGVGTENDPWDAVQ